jgi:16S rRNA (guanine966-N2)-methyltransferase
VESDPAAVRALRANVAASGLAARSDVLPVALERSLRTLARRGTVVDGVVADPPYGAGWVQRAVDAVAASGVLAPDAWMAVEHRVDEPPVAPAGHVVVQSRRHGRTAVTLLVRAEEAG